MDADIVFLDTGTLREVGHCRGPAADGSCPRVAIGEVIACAGCIVAPAGSPRRVAYPVGAQMTLCPQTLAAALAVPCDWPFAAGETPAL